MTCREYGVLMFAFYKSDQKQFEVELRTLVLLSELTVICHLVGFFVLSLIIPRRLPFEPVHPVTAGTVLILIALSAPTGE